MLCDVTKTRDYGKRYLYTVLEVGRDEAGWHPVSFRKAPKPSLCHLTVAKSSRHLFSRFETIPLFFSSVKSLLAFLLFCTISNVNMDAWQ
jgi:hypothetical protein